MSDHSDVVLWCCRRFAPEPRSSRPPWSSMPPSKSRRRSAYLRGLPGCRCCRRYRQCRRPHVRQRPPWIGARCCRHQHRRHNRSRATDNGSAGRCPVTWRAGRSRPRYTTTVPRAGRPHLGALAASAAAAAMAPTAVPWLTGALVASQAS